MKLEKEVEEEHKLRQEEVRRRWDPKLGYRKARRAKPYQTARKSCCGGKCSVVEESKDELIERGL